METQFFGGVIMGLYSNKMFQSGFKKLYKYVGLVVYGSKKIGSD